MKKINVNTIIESLERDSEKAKNKPTNNLILNMLDNTSLEYLSVEPTRSGDLFNRGSIVECIVRNVLNEYINGASASHYKKSLKNEDFTTNKKAVQMVQDLGLEANKNYEIKLITSLARASMSQIITNDIIMIDLRKKTLGAYLVKPNNLIVYNGSSIKDYTNGVRLDLLCELLGLE